MDLRESRSKTYLDVDDSHGGSTSMIENTCDSNQKSVFALSRVNGNDAALTIHAQDGRTRRINRECVSHIQLLSAQRPSGDLAALAVYCNSAFADPGSV